MKRTTLLVFCILGMQSIFAQNETHTNTATLENGAVIVQSTSSIASPNTPVIKPNPVRTIDDWNLAECDEALRNIQLKIQVTTEADAKNHGALTYYKEEQEKILKRKAILTKQYSK